MKRSTTTRIEAKVSDLKNVLLQHYGFEAHDRAVLGVGNQLCGDDEDFVLDITVIDAMDN